MQTRSRRGLATSISLGAAIALGGCSSGEPQPAPPPPTRIEARLAAAVDVNPDIYGDPSPIVVRLYQLAGETAFSNADFFQLHDDDAAALGGELIARSEHSLVPGESVEIAEILPGGVRFLGVTAAYQAIEIASWRALIQLPAHQTTTFTVAADRLSVSFQNVASPDPSKDEEQ